MVRPCRIASTFITLMGEHIHAHTAARDDGTNETPIDRPSSDLPSFIDVELYPRIVEHAQLYRVVPPLKAVQRLLPDSWITSEPFNLP